MQYFHWVSWANKSVNHLHKNGKTLCFVIIDPRDSKYNEKRIEPRIDPCDTPQGRDACDEWRSPIITEKLLFARYDLNHWRVVPRMPTYCSRQDTRTAWLTVSKDAVRSSSTRIPSIYRQGNIIVHLEQCWLGALSGSKTRLKFIKNRIYL